jgi:hypothetical protein
MPINRNNLVAGGNKKYITESDVRGAVMSALSEVFPIEVLDKLKYKARKARNPFDLVDKVANIIRRRLDEVVDLVIRNLDLVRRIADKGQKIYYLDTLENKEIPFDVYLTKRDYRVEGRDPVDILMERAKEFLKEVFGEDDLAESFAYVFIDFVRTPDSYIFDKFTTEYEKEQAKRRMRGLEERTRRYRKKKLEESEREPTEEELRKIEESGDYDDPWDFPI